MEGKLQDSFKYEIIGKALDEYVSRKYESSYHDVSMEQFASVASAVLYALESYGDLFVTEVNCDEVHDKIDIDKFMNEVVDRVNKYSRNEFKCKLQDKNSIEAKLDRYYRAGRIEEIKNMAFNSDNEEVRLKATEFLMINMLGVK